MNPTLLVIGGPTGSGKNRIALEIAGRYSGEIVNADSRQIYRDLKIGTNHPAAEEMRQVPHHLYGFLEPNQSFSGADYQEKAAMVIHQIFQRGNLPVVVGGTGFYIKALLRGVWAVPPGDETLRNRFRDIEKRRGKQFLHKILQRLDAASAAQIAPNDSYRTIRSLEILFQTGTRRSELPRRQPEKFNALKYYLNADRKELLERIRARTLQMFDEGWVEEVRHLLHRYPEFEAYPAAASLGYREIIRYLKGEIDLRTCQDTIILRTTQYAKRQQTWFRNQDGFVPLPSPEELHKILDSVLQLDRMN